ncbi:hypothetical protein JRQ81_014433 [Phrynocephalus forsythii]|uniref:Uncharacterized protein n=1 Tax=Phrynocephalus forsythii TaxID=171643 RepID=A0A9Q0XWP5_9SAUR|nr:hypothetical protein JRQ81_014433 [Phrynocephalus forsythii]
MEAGVEAAPRAEEKGTEVPGGGSRILPPTPGLHQPDRKALRRAVPSRAASSGLGGGDDGAYLRLKTRAQDPGGGSRLCGSGSSSLFGARAGNQDLDPPPGLLSAPPDEKAPRAESQEGDEEGSPPLFNPQTRPIASDRCVLAQGSKEITVSLFCLAIS